MMNFWFCVLGCLAVSAMNSAYPIYGAKRFRPYSPISLPMYGSRPTRQYYLEPYAQDLSPEVLDFYPQEPYDRYRYYQIPYYFPEASPYYYDEDEIPEELDEDKVEEPFNPDFYNQDGNAKANAYFLQNLMLAQMYKDAGTRIPLTYGYPRDDYEEYVYGEPVKETKEDEDVDQLKSLVNDNPKRQQMKSKQDKPKFPDNTWTEKRAAQNNQEESPQRQQPRMRPHEPSAYDAIKKLLHSQQKKREPASRQPQKRSYIPNEDALVEQLDNLKKSA